MITLRDYQEEALKAVRSEWQGTGGHGKVSKTLLVLATGCGKTIIFCKLAEEMVREGKRVLILAHREELLDQAREKLKRTTGLDSVLEKAESHTAESGAMVTVGSIQTMASEKRLAEFDPYAFDVIIVDEAHHTVSKSYLKVLEYFATAKVLGVTATADRGDKKALKAYYDSIAYEYGLAQAIKDGHLAPIRAYTSPLEIDISKVKSSHGDYQDGDLSSAIEPYLDAIAREMAGICKGRKTLAFLPLIDTSKRFCQILRAHGLRAEEVNGQSSDRKEKLEAFRQGEIDVLCNAMLLTEGYDEPSIDTILILRPTQSRPLYTQMVGRGTRLYPGKNKLLLLDFLWLTGEHDLCKPASLSSAGEAIQKKMAEKVRAGEDYDLLDLEEEASEDYLREREEALQKRIEEKKVKKQKLVDPIAVGFALSSAKLVDYEPTFRWEGEPATEKQCQALERFGVKADSMSKGQASVILEELIGRASRGLATIKQIQLLERRGFTRAEEWTKEEASQMIDMMAKNRWQVPYQVIGSPKSYLPKRLQGGEF